MVTEALEVDKHCPKSWKCLVNLVLWTYYWAFDENEAEEHL